LISRRSASSAPPLSLEEKGASYRISARS
jgi:hypothetical protein